MDKHVGLDSEVIEASWPIGTGTCMFIYMSVCKDSGVIKKGHGY